MKAVVQDRYGPAEVLQVREIEQPRPHDDEVLVRVHAAGVDPGVWHLMTGLPYMIRLGYGLRKPRTSVRGLDFAGVVIEVGKKVTRFHPGDEVFGSSRGSFAEYTRAQEKKVAPKPRNLTFEDAAAIPVSGAAALRGLRDAGKLVAGDEVLILGAAGGVGSFAVQIAKAMGVEVTGVASTTKIDLVRKLGADHVIDYTQEDPLASGKRYDLILDTGGNRPLPRLRRALTEKGTLVLVGGEGGGRWTGGFGRNIRAVLLSRFVSQNLRSLISTERAEDLIFLKDLIEAGKLAPVIDRTYPLSEARTAIRRLEEQRGRGKIVLTVGGESSPRRRA